MYDGLCPVVDRVACHRWRVVVGHGSETLMQLYINEFEMRIARELADERMRQSMALGLDPYAGAKRNRWIDIAGAVGEMAVAKLLDRYPGFTVGTYKQADVAGVQVRATEYKSGHLIIRPNDADQDVFILVCGVKNRPEMVEVVGWCTGKEAKTQLGEWQRLDHMRTHSWVVAANKLHPLHELNLAKGTRK